jgi:hypothetical protein
MPAIRKARAMTRASTSAISRMRRIRTRTAGEVTAAGGVAIAIWTAAWRQSGTLSRVRTARADGKNPHKLVNVGGVISRDGRGARRSMDEAVGSSYTHVFHTRSLRW